MLRLCLLVFAAATALGFMPTSAPVGKHAQLRARCAKLGVVMQAAGEGSAQRRSFLRLAVGAAAAAATGGRPSISGAEVFFDTERYGDKELKVALINQVKQQFRALFEKRPELIVPLFKLAMADSLTYDPKTNEGGLNGGVLRKLDPSIAYLKPALDEVERIRDILLSKTEVSCSDLLAFAGGVAIEATGGPRVKMQLGRIDGKKDSPPSNILNWDPKAPTAAGIKDAFTRSGLSVQETVLLVASVGQLRQASTAMSTALANKVPCNPDEDLDCNTNEEGYFGIYSPVTILSETSRQFGKGNRGASAVNSNTGFDSARIAGLAGDATFGNSWLASLAKEGPKDKLGEALMGDEELKKWVMEYGNGNKNKFGKEAVSAYLKMVELGRTNTNR